MLNLKNLYCSTVLNNICKYWNDSETNICADILFYKTLLWYIIFKINSFLLNFSVAHDFFE